MFGFGKKEPLVKDLKHNEELLLKTIFSAEEAVQMGIEAKAKKRNDNRKEVFRQLKQGVNAGLGSMRLGIHLFEDNNLTYFEGLGYKVKKIYVDRQGVEHVGEPPEPELVQSQPMQSSQGGMWGQGMVQLSPSSYYYSPQSYIKISWE